MLVTVTPENTSLEPLPRLRREGHRLLRSQITLPYRADWRLETLSLMFAWLQRGGGSKSSRSEPSSAKAPLVCSALTTAP